MLHRQEPAGEGSSHGQPPQEIVQAEGLGLVSDDSAIRASSWKSSGKPEEVESYKAGKGDVNGLVRRPGDAQNGGKADPNLARRILEELLA